MMLLKRLLVVSLLLTGKESYLQQPDHLNTSIPKNNKIEYGKLKNGFSYSLLRDTGYGSQVVLYLTVKVGNAYESDRQVQFAHLIEHLAFRGGVWDSIKAWGGVPGRLANASTGDLETTFYFQIEAKYLVQGLQMLYHFAHTINFDSTSVDKEKGAVASELRQASGYENHLSDKLLANIYEAPGVPSKSTPIAYLIQQIVKVDHHELFQFFRKWYQPGSQHITIVGDIAVDSAELIIKKLFCTIPPGEPVSEQKIEARIKKSFYAFHDELIPNTKIKLIHTIKKDVPATTYKDIRDDLTDRLFFKLAGNRLAYLTESYLNPLKQLLVHKQVIYSGWNAYQTDIEFDDGDYRRGLAIAFNALNDIRKNGFSYNELQKARVELEKNILAEKHDLFSMASEINNSATSGAVAADWQFKKDLSLQLLNDITLKEVEQFAAIITGADNMAVVLVSSATAARLPSEKQIRDWWMNSRNQQIIKGKQMQEQDVEKELALMTAHLPRAGYLTDYYPDINVSEIVLPNGIKIALRPADKIGRVMIRALKPYGPDSVTDISADDVIEIITNSGIGNIDKFKLNRFARANNLSVLPFAGKDQAGFVASSSSSQLENLLRLVYLYITRPPKNQLAFEDWKKNRKKRLSSERSDSGSLFEDSLYSILHPDNKVTVRYQPPELISLHDVLKKYQQLFSGASGYRFVITGDFSADSIMPMLAKYLGALPLLKYERKFFSPPLRLPGRELKKVWHQKNPGDKAEVMISLVGCYHYDLKNNVLLEILNESLGSSFSKRLRDEEGATYFTNTTCNIYKQQGGVYKYSLGFYCDKNDVDRLIKAVKEEIQKVRMAKFSLVYLNQYLRLQTNQLNANNTFWSQYLIQQYQTGGALQEISQKIAIAKSITVNDIEAAARRYLFNDKLIILVLKPGK